MNTIRTIAIMSAVTTLASCQDSRPTKLSVRLTDDSGKPVAAYKVRASWCDEAATKATRNEWGIQKEVWTGKFAETDQTGRATFEMPVWTGEVGFNLIQGLAGNEDRYYLTEIPAYKFQRIEDGRWAPDNPVIEAVLKRKLKPIPMYAKNYQPGSSENLWPPSVGQEYGFDFQAGDWVVPTGKGKTRDILFKLEYEKSSTGDYKQLIRVSFPNKGDGLLPFDGPVGTTTDHLTLRSDHSAPVDGYQPVVELYRTSTNKVIKDDANPYRNYYFRVRTNLDADGKVVSAHYGKIYGDFMSFIYYFNPTPNDRNVEYDPKRNLFVPEGKPFYQWPEQYRVTRP